MNVNLIYQQTGYRFQISKYTPLTFIYDVALKVFQIENRIQIFYKDQIVPCEHIYSSNFFKKFPITLNILEVKNPVNQNQNQNQNQSQTKSKTKKKEEKYIKEKQTIKPKKKNFVKCQICTKKNSIFYCRDCNQFVCFECNIRFPEHLNHHKLSLESGDLFLSFEEYRNIVLGQLNELNNGYKFSGQNIYTEQKRTEIFEELIETLNELDKKTQSLTVMSSSYKCTDELLKNYNKELKEIVSPKVEDEIVNCFSLINDKESEINHYIHFVTLQIIKSKFNTKFDIFIKNTKKLFDELMTEINDKIHESLNLNQLNYNYIISYNKEKYKEQYSSSSSSSSSSYKKKQTSNFKKNSIENSSSSSSFSLSNIKKSNFKKRNSVIERKIDIRKIINRNQIKKNKNIDNKRDINENNINNNNKSMNILKKINKKLENSKDFNYSFSIKEDKDEYKNDNDYFSLPKLKTSINALKKINTDKNYLLSPIKNDNSKIDFKNIKTIQKSIKNVLDRSKRKNIDNSNEINNYNKIKLYNEDSISKNENEKRKEYKILQSNNNKYIHNLFGLYNQNQIKKKYENNINSVSTNSNNMKSYDEKLKSSFAKSLKKITPNKKIKLYDTYKIKDTDTDNISNTNDYSAAVPLKISKKIKRISPISINVKNKDN